MLRGDKSSYTSKQKRKAQQSGAENRMTRYAIVVEKGGDSYGAYVPDLPGCVAAAETRAEVLELIRDAMKLHIEGLRGEGLRIPEPSSTAEYIEVAA